MANITMHTVHHSIQQPSSATSELPNEAFVLRRKDEFCFETRPYPTLPSERHVIVAIKATGLCGSDVHYWQHGEIGDFKVRNPIILGHESAGIVWQCGSEVQTLRTGDAVAIEPGIPCRRCAYCKEGRYNLCSGVNFAATPPFDGTLQRYYTIPEDFCYKLDSSISFEEGALLEPLSVAVHCARLSDITYGSSVLVLGAGPIGLLCCAVARAYGASEVAIVDVVPARLAFALQFAATTAHRAEDISPRENAAAIISTCSKQRSFDVVIDATGAETCISIGIHALKKGGVFVQAGLGRAEIAFPIAQLCAKEATFRGSFRYGARDFDIAMKLVEQKKVQLKLLITHRFTFQDAEQAFHSVAQRQGIKTIILGPDVDPDIT